MSTHVGELHQLVPVAKNSWFLDFWVTQRRQVYTNLKLMEGGGHISRGNIHFLTICSFTPHIFALFENFVPYATRFLKVPVFKLFVFSS